MLDVGAGSIIIADVDRSRPTGPGCGRPAVYPRSQKL
jgi:hypothetical protein